MNRVQERDVVDVHSKENHDNVYPIYYIHKEKSLASEYSKN